MEFKSFAPVLFIFALLISCKSTDNLMDYSTIQHKVDLTRFDSTIAKFEEQDKKARYSKDLILFTGSSSIVFWKTLSEDMAPYPVLNRGFGGSILPEMNHYFDRVVKKYHPQIIFLYCGENDISEGYAPEESYSSYREFISKCTAAFPETQIVFISMKPSPSRWDKWSEMEKANGMIKAYTKQYDHLHFVDVGPTMMQDGEPDKSIFVQDMLHMNSIGYMRWAAVIKPVLDRLMGG